MLATGETGSAAGGNRIRTIGPAVEETPFPTPDVSFRANGSDLRHSLRGTEGSNPLPSSGESGANLIFGGESHRAVHRVKENTWGAGRQFGIVGPSVGAIRGGAGVARVFI